MQDDPQDYYQALEVQHNADQDQIKQAFRKLAREYHPDKVATLGVEFQELAQYKMGVINEAYTVLSDPARRTEYDRMLQTGAGGWGRPPAARKKPPAPAQPQVQPQPQPAQASHSYQQEEFKKEASHEQMLIDTALYRIRDDLKTKVKLNWEDINIPEFSCSLAGRTLTHRYYVYFKSIYALTPMEFNSFMMKLRRVDQGSKAGFGGKDSLFVLAFSRMQEGIKVENLWKRFNEEATKTKKGHKYITLINTATSKVFPPKVEIKGKRMQQIVKNVRLPR